MEPPSKEHMLSTIVPIRRYSVLLYQLIGEPKDYRCDFRPFPGGHAGIYWICRRHTGYADNTNKNPDNKPVPYQAAAHADTENQRSQNTVSILTDELSIGLGRSLAGQLAQTDKQRNKRYRTCSRQHNTGLEHIPFRQQTHAKAYGKHKTTQNTKYKRIEKLLLHNMTSNFIFLVLLVTF